MTTSREFYETLRAALGGIEPVSRIPMVNWDKLNSTQQGYYTSAIATGKAAVSIELEATGKRFFDAYAALVYPGTTFASLSPTARAAWVKCSGVFAA